MDRCVAADRPGWPRHKTTAAPAKGANR
jgi:hypothetical protein